ncbi:hypothetical protein Tco_1467954 [Tanacetum coccineum]
MPSRRAQRLALSGLSSEAPRGYATTAHHWCGLLRLVPSYAAHHDWAVTMEIGGGVTVVVESVWEKGKVSWLSEVVDGGGRNGEDGVGDVCCEVACRCGWAECGGK